MKKNTKKRREFLLVLLLLAGAGAFFFFFGEKKKKPPGHFRNSIGMEFVPVEGTDVLFSVYETRVRDFEAFVEATGYDAGKKWKDPGHKQTGAHPVVEVSWDDAMAFCAWLSKKEGREYRLPTDHEWSVAVGIGHLEDANKTPAEKNMGVNGVYPWGKEWPPPLGAGNYRAGSIDGYDDPYEDKDSVFHDLRQKLGVPWKRPGIGTAPVGKFTANVNHLHDLGGNVWEWCQTDYDTGKNEKEDKGASRVLRGASWDYGYRDRLLSSYRFFLTPNYRYCDFGFRVVVSSSP